MNATHKCLQRFQNERKRWTGQDITRFRAVPATEASSLTPQDLSGGQENHDVVSCPPPLCVGVQEKPLSERKQIRKTRFLAYRLNSHTDVVVANYNRKETK